MHTMYSSKFAVLILALGLLLVWFTASASAQGHGFHGEGEIAPRGVPASVTSFGFGGRAGFHGVPASVTSQGFGGSAFRSGFSGGVVSREFNGRRGNHEGGNHEGRFDRHHHHDNALFSPFYGGYYNYMPYAYPYYPTEENYPTDDTASDSGYDSRSMRDLNDRQVLNDDYRAQVTSSPEQQPQTPAPQAAPQPVTAQPSTVLIFKDGHQLEVANYAIVGDILYDLIDDGHSKKVQLAELNLTATVKQNDERGVEFHLPEGTKLN